MKRLNVNPTRMELQNLKKRIVVARRGHKLLKDKRDELMKRFLPLVEEVKNLRKKVENKLSSAFKSFILSQMETSPQKVYTALSSPSSTLKLKSKLVSSLKNPRFQFEYGGDLRCYGYLDTSAELDNYLRILSETFPLMLKLSEKEKEVFLLAKEIERTRRRVNALEYVLIPQLEITIRYITLKLDELERSRLSILMKIKEMVR